MRRRAQLLFLKARTDVFICKTACSALLVNADHIVGKLINNFLFLPVLTIGNYINYLHTIIIKRLSITIIS